MTTSEDILLQVNHVRHKKSDGILFLMSERIGWLMGSKDTFSVSYKYADIKMQKISPDGKPKIQLQVVLQDGGASTFHFNSPDGEEAQRRNRDSVKQLLHKLLPMFQSRVNKELEEKERLLRENPTLLQLYQDLVITRITTADEFWEQHAAEFVAKSSLKQEVGVSGAFLADIRPQTDGCSGLKYNLNADIIASIFKTYPAVRRKHIDHVPAKMTESEFWTRFFQSHYFHRDRTNLSSKDIFTDCAKQDEKEIQQELVRDFENPLLDLRRMSDRTLADGFGGDASTSGSAASSATTSAAAQHANNVNSSMIRRFNQHSISVLKASLESSQRRKHAHAQNNSAESSQPQQNGVSAHPSPIAVKKARLAETVCYSDLETPSGPGGQQLNLTKPGRYLSGPTALAVDAAAAAASHQQPEGLAASGDDDDALAERLRASVQRWKPMQSRLLDAQTAVSVLGELSPGGVLMKSSHKELAATADLPGQVKTDMAGLYRSISELLRHFWSCFPANTPALEQKVTRMHDTLRKFQQCKVHKFEDDLYRQYGLGPEVSAHLNQMLETAYAKYEQWRTLRRK